MCLYFKNLKFFGQAFWRHCVIIFVKIAHKVAMIYSLFWSVSSFKIIGGGGGGGEGGTLSISCSTKVCIILQISDIELLALLVTCGNCTYFFLPLWFISPIYWLLSFFVGKVHSVCMI